MQLIFDPRYRRLVDFLSLDSVELEEPHVPEKIMFLYDWAEKKTKGGDLNAVLTKLSSLKKDIGVTLRGKSLLVDLYKWTRLDADKMAVRENQSLDRKSLTEKEALEIEARKHNRSREKIWKETKEEIAKEAKLAELANKQKFNIQKRVQLVKEQKYKEADLAVQEVKEKPSEAIPVTVW